MANITKEKMLEIVNESIEKLESKKFKVYFFVLDTKGNPSSQLEYIYQTALVLKKRGYDVGILHNEKEFVGVGEWLGKEYAELPHYNVEKNNVEVSREDFIFIPEVFANVMMTLKKFPCKKVMIVQNYNHVTEFMPVTMTPETLGINEAIVTTKFQEEKTKDYFPNMITHIVSPSIKKMFRKDSSPKKLIVNLISKEQSDINQIVKPFYWKNPLYKWVSFRDIRGLSQEDFCNALREAAITIWIDDKTNFGYTLLEAERCGGVVLAKVPNNLSDWMVEDGKLTESVIWFENVDDVPNMLSSLVRSWTKDAIPEDVYTEQDKLSDLYSEEAQEREIIEVYEKNLFEKRLKDFKEAKADVENNVIKEKESD